MSALKYIKRVEKFDIFFNDISQISYENQLRNREKLNIITRTRFCINNNTLGYLIIKFVNCGIKSLQYYTKGYREGYTKCIDMHPMDTFYNTDAVNILSYRTTTKHTFHLKSNSSDSKN